MTTYEKKMNLKKLKFAYKNDKINFCDVICYVIKFNPLGTSNFILIWIANITISRNFEPKYKVGQVFRAEFYEKNFDKVFNESSLPVWPEVNLKAL